MLKLTDQLSQTLLTPKFQNLYAKFWALPEPQQIPGTVENLAANSIKEIKGMKNNFLRLLSILEHEPKRFEKFFLKTKAHFIKYNRVLYYDQSKRLRV